MSSSADVRPVVSRLDTLADELLSNILFFTVYTGQEFMSAIEYLTVDPSSYPGHSDLATKTSLVSHRFNRLAKEVLWRNVVVRDVTALENVSLAASTYGTHTRRFELRLSGPYEREAIPRVLKSMPRLHTFILRNYPSARGHFYVQPSHIVEALCGNCREMQRVQFESSLEEPSDLQVCRVLRCNPELSSLRVARFSPTICLSGNGHDDAHTIAAGHSLRILSLGTDHYTIPSMYSSRAQDSFVGMLTMSGTLSMLQEFHMLEFSPRIPAFLALYGPQLIKMDVQVPEEMTDGLYDPCLLEVCTRVESVVWVGKNWHVLDVNRLLPSSHPTLRHATVICCKLEEDVPPQFMARIRQMLRILKNGDFPSLQHIVVKLRGGRTPSIDRVAWFRSILSDFRKKNSGVHICVQ